MFLNRGTFMTGTSRPIGHCSAAMRRRLQIEEEDLLGRTVKVRVNREDNSEDQRGKGARFVRRANFAVPGMPASRPISPEGKVSFHYAFATVSTAGDGRSYITSSRGKTEPLATPIVDHDRYIAREGAVMTIGAAAFDSYVTGGQTDREPRGDGRQVALLSNISLDPKMRDEFWVATEKFARKSGEERIELDPGKASLEAWHAIAGTPGLPDAMRQAAAEVAAGRASKKVVIPMQREVFEQARPLLHRISPDIIEERVIRFIQPRKGRTQYRLEAELPADITDDARLRIVARFCERLNEVGAMYTAAIHAPDAHNAARNFHFHVVAHDRPAEFIDGQWDFTIATPVPDQHGRQRFAKRKKKIVVAGLKTETNRGDFGAFLKSLRAELAEFCNDELRAAGRALLYDPRTYVEMGIEREPTKHLGTSLSPLEAAGIPTSVGVRNAEIAWTGELRDRLKRCDRDREARKALRRRIVERLEREQGSPAEPQWTDALRRFDEASAGLAATEPELVEYALLTEMAESRAQKTGETCGRILASIEQGRASASDRRQETAIRARLAEAESHLGEVRQVDLDNAPVIERELRRVEAWSLVTDEVAAMLSTPVVQRDRAADRPPSRRAETDPALSLATIIARIREERIPVTAEEVDGRTAYRVFGISRKEVSVLRDPAVLENAQSQLHDIFDEQVAQIRRDLDFCRRAGGIDRLRKLATRKDPLGDVARRAVDNLDRFDAIPREPTPAEAVEPGASRGVLARMASKLRSVIAADVPDQASNMPVAEAASAEADGNVPGPTESWTPSAPIVHVPEEERRRQAAEAIKETIASLVAAIPTSQTIRFEREGEQLRIVPESMPEHQWTIRTFGDQPEIQAAAITRSKQPWLDVEGLDREIKLTELDRALRSANVRPARQSGEQWHVDLPDPELARLAERWQAHPRIAAALADSDQRWCEVEARAAREQSMIKAPARASTAPLALPSFSPNVGQAVGNQTTAAPTGSEYTLEQLAAFARRGNGRAA